MRVLVILNAKAGTIVSSAEKDQATRIRDRFATHGIDAEVRDVPGDQIVAVVKEARESKAYDLVIAGGGDGTLNTVAGALAGGDVPFGVLPLGTFNHLAKELKIPLELDAAIDALAAGKDEPFNIGMVNDQVFLLFAAIGIYSDMIRHRDAQRKVIGRRKMWAGTIAFFKMLARWPLMRVTLSHIDPPTDTPVVRRLTPIVSVSISGYQLQQMGLTDAPRDSRETLSVLVSPHVNRIGLVWVILKGLFNRLQLAKDLELMRVCSVELMPRGRSSVRVGYDGEVATMNTPLKLRLIKGGIRMRMPAEPVGK